MNTQPKSRLYAGHKKTLNGFFKVLLFLPTILLSTTAYSQGSDNAWQTKIVPQAYWQGYGGSTSRDSALNAGVYLVSEYLESAKLRAGYNYTLIDINNDAEITEQIIYLSGEYNMFPDKLPGKLTLRLDAYNGESTLEYNTANPPGKVGGGGMGGGGMSTTPSQTVIKESADITAFQPQLAFINHAKTFYADIGYAYSEYDGTSKTEVDQITPTIGFGWNEGYNWLQLRAYLIKIDDTAFAYSNKRLESLEAKYTYWLKDKATTNMEFIRLSILVGERALAVDPDAGVIYSSADKQKSSLEAGVQWKLSDTLGMLTLVNYSNYVNDTLLDDYKSVLFYVNLQHKW